MIDENEIRKKISNLHSGPLNGSTRITWQEMEMITGPGRAYNGAMFFYDNYAIHNEPNDLGVLMTKLTYSNAGKLIKDDYTVVAN